MSEKSPFAKKLETLDAERWESDVAPDQGTFIDDDGKVTERELDIHEKRKQLEEADAYHRHMEQFANFSDDEIESRREAAADAELNGEQPNDEEVFERNAGHFEELDGPIEGTPEYNEAQAEAERQANEAQAEAERQAGLEALQEKIENDPLLSRMDKLSRKIEDLYAKDVDPDTEEGYANLIRNFENKLNDMLVEYAESDDFDPALGDVLMSRDDEGARKIAAANALLEKREREADPTAPVSTTEKSGTPEEDDETTGTTIPEVNTTPVGEGGTGTTIPEVNTTPVGGSETTGTTIPEVNTTPVGEGGTGTTIPEVNTTPVGGGTTEVQPVPVPERRERMSRGRKIAIALGTAAVVAVSAFAMSKGIENPFKGMGDWIGAKIPDWMKFNEVIDGHAVAAEVPSAPTDGFIDVIDGNPSVNVDTLPPSSGFEFPWNWAEKAVGGNEAMGFLEGLANKAEAAGHAVEWHGEGTTKWVEVDGNSNTQHVIDVLRQYK